MFTGFRFGEYPSGSSHALLDLPPHQDLHTTSEDSSENPETGQEISRNSSSTVGIIQNGNEDQQHSQSAAQPATADYIDPARFLFIRRLGWYLLLTNVGALVLLFGAISTLSFLWFGNESNSNWRHIMVDGWIGQAVTLCTLVIRLVIGIQASTAVAMLAAISLEAPRGVFLSEVPALSLARYVNTGPLTSILPFWNNASWPECGLVFPILVILATCTVISQFTSTLLLWDVRSSVIQDSSRTSFLANGIGMEGFMDRFRTTVQRGQNYWLSSPQTFPTFAEWNTEPNVRIDSIADTGPTLRAFVPISSQMDRSMVNKFEGTATVFDARVACVRPVFTNWTFATGNISNDADTRSYFKGYARPTALTEEIKRILRHNESTLGVPFRCMFDDLDVLTDPMFKICSVAYTNGGLINTLDPTSNSSMNQYFNDEVVHNSHYSNTNAAWMAPSNDGVQRWPVEMGHTFLLLRSMGNSTKSSDFDWGFKSMNFTERERGVWVDFSAGSNSTVPYDTNVNISATLCYDAWFNYAGVGRDSRRIKHVQQFPISASRTTNNSEPTVGWDTQGRAFDTTAVRTQLGVSKGNITDRGILKLDIGQLSKVLQSYSAQWLPGFNFSFNDVRDGQTLWFLNTTIDIPRLQDFYDSFDSSNLFENNTYPTNETYDFLNTVFWWPFGNDHDENDLDHFEIYAPCENCTSYMSMALVNGYPDSVTYQVLNPMLNAIFRDTLIETDNPALAWQALMTTIFRMAYYDWLPTFDNHEYIETVSKVSCQIPMHYAGFVIVVTNIVTHLGLFTAATVLFRKRTRTSLLNNSWQVFAQLKSKETEKLLDDATMADDTVVRHWIKQGFEARRRFWITKSEDCDRVCLS